LCNYIGGNDDKFIPSEKGCNMKKAFLIIAACIYFSFVFAQSNQYKILFDFTKADTASFATVIRHARNVLSASANAQIEIVCHGPGLDLILKDKSTVQKEIEELNKLNVVFAACEATMKRRGIVKDQLVPQARTVSSAILEIALKQQQGWSYIKEGY
jgi:intracellular sulfur oxidation DsrE/DsrF family protein